MSWYKQTNGVTSGDYFSYRGGKHLLAVSFLISVLVFVYVEAFVELQKKPTERGAVRINRCNSV